VFAGANSVNYAAISIALSIKCKVFVVAETNEQLENIKRNYPGVSKRNYIYSSIVIRE
jgi:fatty acid synthase